MNFCDLNTIFHTFAEEVFEKIRLDKESAPEKVQPILTYVEKHLFSPDLKASAIYEACGIRDRSISSFFRLHIGLSPWHYIENCRIEVAEKMVCETPIPISWLALFLGYASMKVFSNAFKRRFACGPLAYRKRHRVKSVNTTSTAKNYNLERILEFKKALQGRLELADVDRLVRSLYQKYPDLERLADPNSKAIRDYLI